MGRIWGKGAPRGGVVSAFAREVEDEQMLLRQKIEAELRSQGAYVEEMAEEPSGTRSPAALAFSKFKPSLRRRISARREDTWRRSLWPAPASAKKAASETSCRRQADRRMCVGGDSTPRGIPMASCFVTARRVGRPAPATSIFAESRVSDSVKAHVTWCMIYTDQRKVLVRGPGSESMLPGWDSGK